MLCACTGKCSNSIQLPESADSVPIWEAADVLELIDSDDDSESCDESQLSTEEVGFERRNEDTGNNVDCIDSDSESTDSHVDTELVNFALFGSSEEPLELGALSVSGATCRVNIPPPFVTMRSLEQ